MEANPREDASEYAKVFLHIEGFGVIGIRNFQTRVEDGSREGKGDFGVSEADEFHRGENFPWTCYFLSEFHTIF